MLDPGAFHTLPVLDGERTATHQVCLGRYSKANQGTQRRALTSLQKFQVCHQSDRH